MAMQMAAKARPGVGQPDWPPKPEPHQHVVHDALLYSKNQRKIRPEKTSGSAQGRSSAEPHRPL